MKTPSDALKKFCKWYGSPNGYGGINWAKNNIRVGTFTYDKLLIDLYGGRSNYHDTRHIRGEPFIHHDDIPAMAANFMNSFKRLLKQ